MACDNMQKSMAHCENIRDSGVEWLGEIPAHWNVTRIKYAAQLSPACDIKKLNSDAMITFTPMECIHDGYFDNKSVPLSYIKGTYTPYAEGDIVLAKVTPCFENGNISVMEELASGYGLGSSELFVLRPYAVNKWYLFYYLRNEQFIQRACASMTGTGGLKRIPGTFIQNYPLLLPSPEEQEAISKYLNDKCAQINSLISEIESTIKEYVSWKSSIIYEAVTKGLDQNVEMKDSGVDIIGYIPKDWTLRRLKFLCSVMTGNQDTQNAVDNGIYPFYVRSPIVELSNVYTYEGEGVLMAGDGAGAGRVFHHAFGKYAIHQRVYCFHDFHNILPDYFYYFMSELFKHEMDKGSAQSTVPSVRMPMIVNFQICLPPIDEQRHIVKAIEKSCKLIDSIIAEKEQLIVDLTDYKKSLIFEVVTGKRRIIS